MVRRRLIRMPSHGGVVQMVMLEEAIVGRSGHDEAVFPASRWTASHGEHSTIVADLAKRRAQASVEGFDGWASNMSKH